MNQRSRGLVIYISSGSSSQPTPMQASYAGGKKLLDNLALNMNNEYEHITFQVKDKIKTGRYMFTENFTIIIPVE